MKDYSNSMKVMRYHFVVAGIDKGTVLLSVATDSRTVPLSGLAPN